jgi:hypothetical protein
MLDVSGAWFLKEHIANSTVVLIEECGHVMQLDQPKLTCQYLLEFYEKNA